MRPGKDVKICSICKKHYVGEGNSAVPINKGRCCDLCNKVRVVPAKIDEAGDKDEKQFDTLEDASPEFLEGYLGIKQEKTNL